MRSFALSMIIASAVTWAAPSALGQQPRYSDNVIRIGVLNDRSGPFSSATGEGSAVAARLAAEDFNGNINGVPIEIVVGDHLGKADVGALIARRWLDLEQVDAIADVGNSAVGLAVNKLITERKRVLLNTSAALDFTGKACSPFAAQWNYNSFASTNAIVTALLESGQNDTWFIIAPDFAFGQSQAAEVRRLVEAKGGKIVGSVFHPLGGSDFSSYLLQAQSSGAKVIAVGSVANDLVNMIKQSHEFAIGGTGSAQKLIVVPAVNLPEIEALGLEVVQDLLFLSTFEWNRTPESRSWTERFVAKMGRLPAQNQASVYSAVRHFLQAAKEANSDNAEIVSARMRQMPIRDAFADDGELRADGQMVHDLFIVQAKKPSEMQEKGDYFRLVRKVAGKTVFQPLYQGPCTGGQ